MFVFLEIATNPSSARRVLNKWVGAVGVNAKRMHWYALSHAWLDEEKILHQNDHSIARLNERNYL